MIFSCFPAAVEDGIHDVSQLPGEIKIQGISYAKTDFVCFTRRRRQFARSGTLAIPAQYSSIPTQTIVFSLDRL